MQKLQQYIFILGNNPALSIAEIKAVLPLGAIVNKGEKFLVLEHKEFKAEEILKRLGGTIKIGRVVGTHLDPELAAEELKKLKKISHGMSPDTIRQGRSYGVNKINFGFSFYGVKPNRLGMDVKKILKADGLNSRLVVSRDSALSSVIVKKEKCLDFLVLPSFFGLTEAVQDFEEYGELDFGRPGFDSHSGMLPPKVAKMMINLSGAQIDDVILDPFCGSGTVLLQSAMMGYQNLVGCDISEKAVEDTKKNMVWLSQRFNVNGDKWQIFLCDAKSLSKSVSRPVGAVSRIVTEPYLGPAFRGEPATASIIKTKAELEKLYLEAFYEFKKILKSGGRVVMIFPEWHLNPIVGSFTERNLIYKVDIDRKIQELGFEKIGDDLIYKREGQKVWRVIKVFSL